MIITRSIENQIIEKINGSERLILIYGARNTGKTTLINGILRKLDKKTLVASGKEKKHYEILSSGSFNQMQRLVAGFEVLYIEEGSYIPNIYSNLKIIHNHIPELKIIVTSSSSFELSNEIKIGEIAEIFYLYPFSLYELNEKLLPYEMDEKLPEYLTFGIYPVVLGYKNDLDKKNYLKELTKSLLYKDFLELNYLKNANKIHDLLRTLAFHIGSPVSYNELGRQVGLSTDNVITYIDFLEKSFVIFRLAGFSKNLKKEITKNKKVYFWDVGVRNFFIENFENPDNRFDIDALWENFIIAERLKRNSYHQANLDSLFWRTYTGARLDLVEQGNTTLTGYQIRWKKKKSKVPNSWQEFYPESDYHVITPENYQDFCCR